MRGKSNISQGDAKEKDNNDANVDVEKDKLDLDEDNLNQIFVLDEHGFMKNGFGNLVMMKMEINTMKEKI